MNGEIHELCSIFPEMPDREINDLAKDIAQVGLIDPVVTYEGKILDGRNRYRACLMVGVPPRREEWSGQAGSPLRFVVSRNLTRRNLTTEQRAAIAVEIKDRINEEYRARSIANLKYSGEDAKDRVTNNCNSIEGSGRRANAQKEAAAMMQVNHAYVSEADRIRDASPAVFDSLKAAELTVPEAKRLIADPEKLAAVNERRARPSDFIEKRSRRPADLTMQALVAAASKAADNLYRRFGSSDDVAVCEAAHDVRQAILDAVAARRG